MCTIILFGFPMVGIAFLITFRKTYLHYHLYQLLCWCPLTTWIVRTALRPDFRHYTEKVHRDTISATQFDTFYAVAYRPLLAELMSCPYCLSWHVGFWLALAAALVLGSWAVLPFVLGAVVLGRHMLDPDVE